MTERKSLESERAELADQLDACVTRSGGIDLRDPELLRRAASALRSLAAQDQKPVEYINWRGDASRKPDTPKNDEHMRVAEDWYAWGLHRGRSSPPPAAGWDQAITELTYACDLLKETKQGSPARSPGHNARLVIEKLIEALRRNAPPDSGAGKSEIEIVDLAKDLVVLWESPRIQGLPRSERNSAIEDTRNEMIEAVHKLARSSVVSEQGSSISKVEGSNPSAPATNSHVAQSVEPSAHNRKDAGSSPAVRTNMPDHGGADAGVKKQVAFYRGMSDAPVYSGKHVANILETVLSLSHQPAPVAANASAEQWATELPDGSVSFDAYAGWSRDQLKDRCLDLIGRIEQLEEAANASAVATYRLGRWLAAALEDPNVCAEMKADIDAWIDAGQPNVQPSTNASAEARLREALKRIEYGIDIRLNEYLCEMKPDYDDSITGFNEAWDIVRKFLKDKIAALSAHPHASDCDKQEER